MIKTIKLVTILLFFHSINTSAQVTRVKDLEDKIESLKSEFDTKLNKALINLNIETIDNSTFLNGYVSDSIIYKKLREYISTNNLEINIENLIVVPINNASSAIVNVSVADIHIDPGFTKSMATQELLGTVVKVLYTKNGWSLIQCPNKYFGWISNRQIVEINKDKLNEWENKQKITYTASYGSCYDKPEINELTIVSDLVTNNILCLLGKENGFYKVEYPDDRIGYVELTNAQLLEDSNNTNIDIAEIMNSVLKMKGLPYIWGGLSTKGVDCSGLVCAAFRDNGYYTYRDASQQALVGEEVKITDDCKNMEYGDLMFFGENKNQIRHVGFYLGNKKFIHASGFVRISSLDKSDIDFDELNTAEFVLARRYINNKNIIESAISIIDY